MKKEDSTGFDEKFRQLFTAMVELAFEFVGRNKQEVDEVYVFGSMEKVYYSFNTFYRINGVLTEKQNVNTVSRVQYDVSQQRIVDMLLLGNRYLEETAGLFREAGREVPTLMKMVYHPKTGAFDNDLGYDLHYTNHPTKVAGDVFEEWFVELGGKPF